jgi:hypothetical protein
VCHWQISDLLLPNGSLKCIVLDEPVLDFRTTISDLVGGRTVDDGGDGGDGGDGVDNGVDGVDELRMAMWCNATVLYSSRCCHSATVPH